MEQVTGARESVLKTVTLNIHGSTGERRTVFQLTSRDMCSDTGQTESQSLSDTGYSHSMGFLGGCLSVILPNQLKGDMVWKCSLGWLSINVGADPGNAKGPWRKEAATLTLLISCGTCELVSLSLEIEL